VTRHARGSAVSPGAALPLETLKVTPVRAKVTFSDKERIRHLLVKEDGRLGGIVRDRDIRLNLPSQATSLSVWEVDHLLARLTVGEIMTKGVIITDPDQEVRAAARLMLEDKIGALSVLDGEHLVGSIANINALRQPPPGPWASSP
jgi:acetoin utilization protein AcuB